MWTKLLDSYIGSSFDLPAPIKQALTNSLVSLDHSICYLMGGNYSPGAPESDEIAESSSELMAAQYDQPLQIFEQFLGDSMKYSMGLWENGAGTLEAAQDAMMEDICEKMEIQDGQTILDIGCGFGSFAKHVLSKFSGCRVTGLTMSQVQANFIRGKQREHGHPFQNGRFELVQGDFNTIRINRTFDRVVSIGVWEHISNLDKAHARVRELVKGDGKVFLHFIVYFEGLARISERPLQSSFISKHIFPGGRIWSIDELGRHQKDLRIEKIWRLNGKNYERTIQCWLTNLRSNSRRLKEIGVEPRKIKLWEFYFGLCIAIFHANRGRFYGNAQYLLSPHSGGQPT